jgi:hypothetical protein
MRTFQLKLKNGKFSPTNFHSFSFPKRGFEQELDKYKRLYSMTTKLLELIGPRKALPSRVMAKKKSIIWPPV